MLIPGLATVTGETVSPAVHYTGARPVRSALLLVALDDGYVHIVIT